MAACNSDEHGRWMLFSMMKLPCEGSYLPSDQSTPDGHPVATVDSQADCQELAEKNSHPFYSFETNKKRCFTSAKCYEPVDTAADNEPWEIHVALWPKHTKTHVACRPTAGALPVPLARRVQGVPHRAEQYRGQLPEGLGGAEAREECTRD